MTNSKYSAEVRERAVRMVRAVYGIEPICRVLPIAPSTYHRQAAQRRDPDQRSARKRRDEALSQSVRRVFAENFEVHGAMRCAMLRCFRVLRRLLVAGWPAKS